MVEGEAVEKASENVKHEFSEDIIRGTPVSDEGSFDDRHGLDSQGHGVFTVVFAGFAQFGVRTRFNQFFDLFGSLLVFIAVGPDVSKIFTVIVWITCSDDFQHPFSWIGRGGTFLAAIMFEVVDHGAAVFTEWTMIYDPTT